MFRGKSYLTLKDASFPEIPDIAENFHAQEACRIFSFFTSFQNKRKKSSEKTIE